MTTLKKTFLSIVLLLSVNMSHAEPKLFSSDWPVWYITKGMYEKKLLNDFSYQIKEYESTLRWFKAGNLDVTFMTLYDFISIQPTKKPTVILGITDYSNGGDKIILRNDIKEARDLKGKKVLLATNTISLWLLHNYLIQNNMTLDDVVIVNENVNLAPLLFKEDLSFSAVIGWNPSINKALTDNSYVACTSADFPRVIYDLIVAQQDFTDQNPALVEKLLTNYFDSLFSKDILEETARSLSVSPSEYQSWLEDAYIFPSRQLANQEHQNLINNAERILFFLNTPPKSIHDLDTINNFKQRNLTFESMINFNKSTQ